MSYLDSSLFAGISKEGYEEMIRCFHPTISYFQSGDEVYAFNNRSRAVGIVRRGSVLITRTDINGVHTILETVAKNEIFGDIFYENCIWKGEISVICGQDCEVMFIDFYHVTKRCVNACIHHSVLVQNMLSLIAKRASGLSEHIEILSCRTIREKLLSYFTLLSVRSESKQIVLPFSLAALADYLCVDRSAMMRELKKLRDEGRIKTDRRCIELQESSAAG